MEIDFAGKSALVTGGGRGIGRGIAEALVKYGAETFVIDKDEALLKELKKQVQCPGIHTVCVDLNDWGATRTAVENLWPIDLLVNNAGICIKKTFLETDEESFDSTLAVNVRAAFNVSQTVAQGIFKRGCGGSIVNLGSVASLVAIEEASAYTVSKFGILGLSKTMALELGQHKIRVNTVCPTTVMTELSRSYVDDSSLLEPLLQRTPLRRVAELEEVVNTVLFLLSDKASMITGASLPIDGGYTC